MLCEAEWHPKVEEENDYSRHVRLAPGGRFLIQITLSCLQTSRSRAVIMPVGFVCVYVYFRVIA